MLICDKLSSRQGNSVARPKCRRLSPHWRQLNSPGLAPTEHSHRRKTVATIRRWYWNQLSLLFSSRPNIYRVHIYITISLHTMSVLKEKNPFFKVSFYGKDQKNNSWGFYNLPPTERAGGDAFVPGQVVRALFRGGIPE